MENILNTKSENGNGNLSPINGFTENRFEALKALANLLIREVESLKPLNDNSEIHKASEKIILSEEVHRFEESLIRDALIRSNGQQRKAARILGTKVTTLNAKIKRYGIEVYSLTGKR